jgi:alcohol dehydrogenase class IV
MHSNYYMPTRVVSGPESLQKIAAHARELGLNAALVVTDPVIARQSYYLEAVRALEKEGISVVRFEDCEIDARVAQIDAQAKVLRAERLDGVISIGGGSVMCAGKGIAIAAANDCSIRECTGAGNFSLRALPMITVPTTAGSGSEVSQWTVIKDDENHSKLVCGGPLSFPDLAILDPVTLESLPTRVAASTGVDALTHALEAYTSSLASPITDALALDAARLLSDSLRRSVCATYDVEARSANMIASSMANIACGNARLGHAHTLSLPLEGLVDLPHPLGVGGLMPHALAFNLVVLPRKARKLANALGVRGVASLSDGEVIAGCVSALRSLYDDIGFPQSWTESQLPRTKIREMAERAVPGLYAGSERAAKMQGKINDDTIIACSAPRKMSVREAEAIYAACLA